MREEQCRSLQEVKMGLQEEVKWEPKIVRRIQSASCWRRRPSTGG